MTQQLSPLPSTTTFVDDKSQSGVSFPWLRWLQQLSSVVTQVSSTPGPYASDAAAKAAGVPVGQQYYQTTGAVVVRLV